MSLRILIGCEFSGIVRDEFIRQGFDAVSCDLLPSESTFGPHIEGDIREILDDGWDVLIGFPDCTFLCNSGVRWLYKGGKKDKEKGQKQKSSKQAKDLKKRKDKQPISGKK